MRTRFILYDQELLLKNYHCTIRLFYRSIKNKVYVGKVQQKTLELNLTLTLGMNIHIFLFTSQNYFFTILVTLQQL